MNLTAKIGLEASSGAAFLILGLNYHNIETKSIKLYHLPRVGSLTNRFGDNAKRQFGRQRCQLRMGYHVRAVIRNELFPTPVPRSILQKVISA